MSHESDRQQIVYDWHNDSTLDEEGWTSVDTTLKVCFIFMFQCFVNRFNCQCFQRHNANVHYFCPKSYREERKLYERGKTPAQLQATPFIGVFPINWSPRTAHSRSAQQHVGVFVYGGREIFSRWATDKCNALGL